MDNANTKEYLDKIRAQVVENLKRTAFAPSVQMTDVPREPLVESMNEEAEAILDELDEEENQDRRWTKRRFDQYVEKPGELSESEDEEMNAANGVRRQPGALKRRNHVNYRNLDVVDSGLDSGMATPQEAGSGASRSSSVADEDMDTSGDAQMNDAQATAFAVDGISTSTIKPESKPDESPAVPDEDTEGPTRRRQLSSPSISVPQNASPVLRPSNEDTVMGEAGVPTPPEHEPELAPGQTSQGKTGQGGIGEGDREDQEEEEEKEEEIEVEAEEKEKEKEGDDGKARAAKERSAAAEELSRSSADETRTRTSAESPRDAEPNAETTNVSEATSLMPEQGQSEPQLRANTDADPV